MSSIAVREDARHDMHLTAHSDVSSHAINSHLPSRAALLVHSLALLCSSSCVSPFEIGISLRSAILKSQMRIGMEELPGCHIAEDLEVVLHIAPIL